MKHAVIMTFPSAKFDVYGFCMRGFIENWPKEVQGYALVEEPENIPLTDIPENLHIIDFNDSVQAEVDTFEKRNAHRSEIFSMETFNPKIQFMAAKFCRKAYAQLSILETIDADVVWYIDADLYTHKPITMELLNSLTSTEAYIGCTPRWWRYPHSAYEALAQKKLGNSGYTETGLMFWKPKHPAHKEWCRLYREAYDNDVIFTHDAWHDCVAFDNATLTLMQKGDITIVDLAYGQRSTHPLVSGPLGKFFDHMKGQRKFAGFSKERVRMHGK